MDLDQPIFDNSDVVAATGAQPATLQSWASRGILRLSDPQRNPGPSHRRLYSALDISRITATQTLIGLGVSAATAAQIAWRTEHEPQRAAIWRSALEQAARHICILVSESGAAPRLCAGNAAEMASLVAEDLNDTSASAVFDVGPAICQAMDVLRGRKRGAAPDSVCEPVPSAAAQHDAGKSPAPIPPPPASRHKEYRSYRYHKGLEPRIVWSAEEDAALGEGWQDLPV